MRRHGEGNREGKKGEGEVQKRRETENRVRKGEVERDSGQDGQVNREVILISSLSWQLRHLQDVLYVIVLDSA